MSAIPIERGFLGQAEADVKFGAAAKLGELLTAPLAALGWFNKDRVSNTENIYGISLEPVLPEPETTHLPN